MQGYRGAILDSQGRLPKEMIFKQRKENEGGSHVNCDRCTYLGTSVQAEGKQQAHRPRSGNNALVCLRNIKEASVVGENR